MSRDGRGLRTAFPDIIPLERTDILADLKQLVDVHRLTDFTVHDRIVPTIELRRVDDELILSFSQFVAQLAANFSICQLWNQTNFCNLRPVAMEIENDQGTGVLAYFDSAVLGIQQQTGHFLDRRKLSASFPGGSVPGQVRILQQAGIDPGDPFWTFEGGVGKASQATQKLCDSIVIPPLTGISFQGGNVNQAITISVAFKIEPLNTTRAFGV